MSIVAKTAELSLNNLIPSRPRTLRQWADKLFLKKENSKVKIQKELWTIDYELSAIID